MTGNVYRSESGEERREMILRAEEAIRALAGELARTTGIAQEAEAARDAFSRATKSVDYARTQIEEAISEVKAATGALLAVSGETRTTIAEAQAALIQEFQAALGQLQSDLCSAVQEGRTSLSNARAELGSVSQETRESISRAQQTLTDAAQRLDSAIDQLRQTASEARDASIFLTAMLRRLQVLAVANLVLGLMLLVIILLVRS